MEFTSEIAPHSPGYPLPWSSSRKSGVGVAAQDSSRIWFTLAEGILTEIFYPRIDRACVRDFQFLVGDGEQFFAEERRDTTSIVEWLEDGAPAYRIRNTCVYGKYRIAKQVVTDPDYHALLIDCVFDPGDSFARPPGLYATLAPRHSCPNSDTSAEVIEHKGDTMLIAENKSVAMAMACSIPFSRASVGYIGRSDGWTDVAHNKRLTAQYRRAPDGNVGLVGEIDWQRDGGRFCLAIGFGGDRMEAAHRARGSLLQGFEGAKRRYIEGWREWQSTLEPIAAQSPGRERCMRLSAAVVAAHQARDFHGGVIASLSCPWGNIHTDDDLGGYHLIWPRDLYHASVAFMAIGARREALGTLAFYHATQEPDGHWPQSMWVDGSAYGDSKQLDETAAPVLATYLARERGILNGNDRLFYWDMVRKAAEYLAEEGPTTNQDRWEELGGISVYTVAISVAALLAAATVADEAGATEEAERWRETADLWNASIDDWCYVTGSRLAHHVGIEGHYIRMRPVSDDEAETPRSPSSRIYIANRSESSNQFRACEITSPDALALVRFGLRRPDDPKILNTIKAIDATLRFDSERGPAWKRYNFDGYGEKRNGDPFDGRGIGRPWPLLTGERGHYELAAGNVAEAKRLLTAMESFADDAGLMPEQVWDAEDIPRRKLRKGFATGSARPLVWAHSEYITLLRSLRDGALFDLPVVAYRRYCEAMV